MRIKRFDPLFPTAALHDKRAKPRFERFFQASAGKHTLDRLTLQVVRRESRSRRTRHDHLDVGCS